MMTPKILFINGHIVNLYKKMKKCCFLENGFMLKSFEFNIIKIPYMKKLYYLTFVFLLVANFVLAQQTKKNKLSVNSQKKSFYSVQKKFYNHWKEEHLSSASQFAQEGEEEEESELTHFKRWEWYWENRIDPVTGAFPKTRASDIIRQRAFSGNGSRSASGNWLSLGPSFSQGGYEGLGRLNCIGFREGDNNTYYVGSPSGGLWKTTDDAATWTAVTDNNPVLGVSDVIVLAGNSTSSDTLYIATGDRDKGSISSFDAGQDNDNNSIGVLKSTDGGANWSATGLTYNASQGKVIYRLRISPDNHNILFAATNDGLLKSTDKGNTWTMLTSTVFYDLEFKPGDAQTMYAGSYNYGDIYVSTDGGSTWSQTLSTPGSRVALTVSPSQANWVYAIVVKDDGLYNFYKSENSGQTFIALFNSINLLGRYCNGSGGGQGDYDLTIAADPNNAYIVYVGGINTWKTADGGNSWNIVNYWEGTCGGSAQEVHADKHRLAFQNGSSTLFECNDGGLYKTADGGQTWEHKGSGIVTGQIYRFDVSQTVAGDVIAGHQDNGTKSVNAGVWEDVIGADGMDCIIDYTDNNVQYGEIYYGQLSKTTNHWASSSIIMPIGESSLSQWITPIAIDPVDHNTIYYSNTAFSISHDGGTTWQAYSYYYSEFAIAPSNTNYIYGVTKPTSSHFARIYKSTDGGATRTEITGDLPVRYANLTYVTVKYNDENTVWVTMGQYNNYSVYETTDGGTTWKDISYGLPPAPVMCLVQNRQNTSVDELYAGTDVGVYVKYGSAPWELFSNGLPNVVVTELKMYYDDNTPSNSRVKAATFGRGVWESDLYTYTPGSPVADFIADDTVPILNQTVLLSDYSSKQPTSWQWTITPSTYIFVDGTNTNSQYPHVQFQAAGDYTIQLTVSNGSGSDSKTRTNYITAGLYHPYCDASGGGNLYISGVQLGDINNTGTSSDGYHDYKSFSTDLYQGQAEIPLTVTCGNTDSGSDLAVWVDWNRDGDFYGDNEKIVCEIDNGGSGTYHFDVPLDADTGLTVMRVRTKEYYNNCGDPCGETTRGEVEDYTIKVTEMPACPPPSYQTEDNILATSADLTWSQIGNISSWDVRVVAAGTDTTGLSYTTVANQTLTVDTLTMSTAYDWYVRSSCGSIWIGPHTFTTSCSSTTQPYSENFDGVTVPDLPGCWSKLEANGNGYTFVETVSSGAQSSPNCVRFYNSNDSAAIEVLVTPQFTDLPLQQNQVRFYAKGYNGNERLIVGSLTRPDSLPTFTPFKTVLLTDSYVEYTVMFGASFDKNDTYIAFKLGTGDYYQSIYLDDFVYEPMPACPPPSDLTEDDITSDGVTLSWLENGQATSWDLRIVPQGTDTTNLSYSTVTNDTITVDTLSANTAYDWYVKEHCGSVWSAKAAFTTNCNTYSATFSENFDAVTTPELPECWSSMVISTNYYVKVETYGYYAHSSPNTVRMSDGSDANDVIMLITPELSDLTSKQNQIRFFAKSSSADEQLVVGTMTNPADTATFTSFTTIDLSDTYSEYTVMFGSTYTGDGTYIALKHGVQVSGSYIYIDDFVYEPMPACPPPSNLQETNIQQTSVTLAWDENGSSSNWDVRLVPKGNDTTGAPYTTFSEHVIIIDTLTANTWYDWYVRTTCPSEWVKSTFVSGCGTYDAPFSENFDAETVPEIPHCWSTIVDSYTTSAKIETLTSQFPNSSPNHVVLDNYSDNNATLLLITPEITDLATQLNQIEFYAKAGDDGDSVIVGTMSDPADASTFTAFKTITLTSNYEHYLVMFGTTYLLSDSYIAFKHGLGGTYRKIYIDDFQYKNMPLNPPPSDLYEDTITQTSVYLGWTENGTATQWDVRIVTEGADTSGVAYAVTSSNPFKVDTLTENTRYEWYVKAHNGEVWGGPSNFVTDCGAYTASYTENFDGVTAPEIPHCWSTIVSSTQTSAVIETNTSGENSYPNHVMLYNYADNSAGLYLISPQFSDLTSQQNQIRFYAKGASSGFTLIVGIMSDPGNASTFTGYDTITLTNSYVEYSLFFGAGYTLNDEYIAFKHGLGGTYRRIYLDDIVYESMPPCPHPTGLTSNNITQTSAALSWLENGTATSWDIRIVEQGGDTAAVPFATTANNPFTVDTLSSATYYDWYVRGSCGGAWEGPATFLTDCGSYTATLTENFDGVTAPELPLCWSAINNSTYPNSTKVETYTSTYPNSSPNHIYMYNYYDNSAELLLVSPQFSDLTAQQNKITFYAKGYSSGYSLIVGTMSDPADPATFTPYQTVNLTNAYAQYAVYFGGGYTGTDEYIAFKHGLGGTYRRIYLDDISYEPITECLEPLNQTVQNIDGNTERLLWTEQGVATSWDVRLVLYGTDTTGLPYATVASKLLVVDTLTPSTSYSWYVRPVCGGTWAGPDNFTTDIANITSFPYAEDFEMSVPPTNWSSEIVTNGATSPLWTRYNSSNYPAASAAEGSYMAHFNSASASTGTMARLITPPFDFSGLTEAGLTFWYYHYHNNSGTGTEGIHVQASADGNSWTDVVPVILRQATHSGWSKYAVNLKDYTGNPSVKLCFFANSAHELNQYIDKVTVYGDLPATATWSGSTDSSWYKSGNWSTADIPFDSTDVIIHSGLTYYPVISTPGAVCKNLLIESDANGDGALKGSENIVVSNSATVKRFLTSGKWHEVAAMVDNSTVNSFYFNGNPSVWMNEFDEPTSTRVPVIQLSTPLVIGKGYEAWIDDGSDTAVTYSGVIHGSDVMVSLSYTHDTLGYNLLGNPFSCPIKFGQGSWNFAGCDETVWVWDPVISNYRSATSAGGSLPGKVIPMGQAFFVHANSAGGSLVIPADSRIISSQDFYKAGAGSSGGDEIRHFTLTVQKGEKADFVWFGFDNSYTEHYDRNYDSRKMKGGVDAPQMYSVDGNDKFMVDALPLLTDGNNLIRPLFFTAGETGEHRMIAVETNSLRDIEVVLEDREIDSLQLLNKIDEYNFYANQGNYPDRFVLHFNYHFNGTDTQNEHKDISVYAYENNIYVSSTGKWANVAKNLKLFDITGRLLMDKNLGASSYSKVLVPLANAIVIVQVESNRNVITKKVFVK